MDVTRIGGRTRLDTRQESRPSNHSLGNNGPFTGKGPFEILDEGPLPFCSSSRERGFPVKVLESTLRISAITYSTEKPRV
jgi:hypothetical protein